MSGVLSIRMFLFTVVLLLLQDNVCGQGKTLVLMGGSMEEDNIAWDRLIELAGGPESRIGVISAASADPEDSANYYMDLFMEKGASEALWIPIHEGNTDANSDPEVIESMQEMTALFFSGGQQSRIINSFYNEDEGGEREASPALSAIWEMYISGVPISGSSAGIACQPRPPMIAGGDSWEALVYGSYHRGDPDRPPSGLHYDPEGGLRMIDDFIVDSHFSERGREGRLPRLLADTMDDPIGAYYGFGVDEDTAFVITDVDTPDAIGEVLPTTSGFGGVLIIDVSNAQEVVGQQCWHLADINTVYVTEGDMVNLGSGQFQVTFADWKSNLVGNENFPEAVTSDDIFGGQGEDTDVRPNYAHVACRLVDSLDEHTYGTTIQDDPMYEVNFQQESGTEAYGGSSPSTGRFLVSYRGLTVEMKAVDGEEDHDDCIS